MDLLIFCCTQPTAQREEKAHSPQASWSPLGEEIVMDPLNRGREGGGGDREGGERERERDHNTINKYTECIVSALYTVT